MHRIHIKWKTIILHSFYRFRGKFRNFLFFKSQNEEEKMKEEEGEGGEKEKGDGAFSVANKIRGIDS